MSEKFSFEGQFLPIGQIEAIKARRTEETEQAEEPAKKPAKKRK